MNLNMLRVKSFIFGILFLNCYFPKMGLAIEGQKILGQVGEMEITQSHCDKEVCDTWLQSRTQNAVKLKLLAESGRLGPLSTLTLAQTFQWCSIDNENPDSKCEHYLKLGLVHLDNQTEGYLITTTEGFETTSEKWKLVVLEGNSFKTVLEGRSGTHSPSTIYTDKGFLEGKTASYYFLQFYWLFNDTEKKAISEIDPKSFFQYQTKRWNSSLKSFADMKTDKLPLWTILLASHKNFAKLQNEVKITESTLEAGKCGEVKKLFYLVKSNEFKQLTKSVWVYGSFSVHKKDLEGLSSKIKQCAPKLNILIKRAI